MNITEARYADGGTIAATIDGEVLFVPDDMRNRERQAIAEWEAEGNTIDPAPAPPPPERRLVPKRVIVDRLHAAGLLEAAKAAIDGADLYTQERWNSRTDIYADDPTALGLLEAIGGDPEVIFAPVEG